jgi:probable rRNA maturation factor
VSLNVDVAADGVRLPVSRERVRRLAEHVLRAERVRDALVSIAFVSGREIARLNERHLGHRGPTDVISFGLAPVEKRGPVVGDVYIAPDVARRNAKAEGAGVREELMRLVIHGVLHVLGHDHPDAGEARYASPMWKRQERLLRSAVRA